MKKILSLQIVFIMFFAIVLSSCSEDNSWDLSNVNIERSDDLPEWINTNIQWPPPSWDEEIKPEWLVQKDSVITWAPSEAIEACTDLEINNTCSFTTPTEDISGICIAVEEWLACAPVNLEK